MRSWYTFKDWRTQRRSDTWLKEAPGRRAVWPRSLKPRKAQQARICWADLSEACFVPTWFCLLSDFSFLPLRAFTSFGVWSKPKFRICSGTLLFGFLKEICWLFSFMDVVGVIYVDKILTWVVRPQTYFLKRLLKEKTSTSHVTVVTSILSPKPVTARLLEDGVCSACMCNGLFG